MSTPLRHLIKENAVAALKLITTANGYNYDISADQVIDHRPLFPNPPKYPTIFIWWETTVNSNQVLTSHSVKVGSLMVGLQAAYNDDPELGMDKLAADIEKAMMVDRYRGGYAIDTELVDDDPDWRPPGQDPTGAVYMNFQITYRHKVGNPFSQ